jgi:hypothetical protein
MTEPGVSISANPGTANANSNASTASMRLIEGSLPKVLTRPEGRVYVKEALTESARFAFRSKKQIWRFRESD